MSELMNVRSQNARWELMTTASVLALLASVYGADQVQAADTDTDRPTVWIELGAQLEQVRGFGDPFSPPFTNEIAADGFTSPLKSQRALSQSFGGEGKISFQPEKSDWIFSASVRYGRANGGVRTHQQTPGGPRHVSIATSSGVHTGPFTPVHQTAKFSEPRTSNNETHTIMDFQAGRDIGLGLFNGGGESTFSFGVRFAQFASNQAFNLIADPDFYFPLDPLHHAKYHHTYTVASHMERDFRGLGPSVSWNASAPVAGSADNGGIALDWGMTAALLVGRQKAIGHHQTTAGFYKTKGFQKYPATHFQRSGNPDRSRAVIVPDVGGFAGASFRFSNAKVSLGYRADFFFGATDAGIDTRKIENTEFHGPYATIGIGLP